MISAADFNTAMSGRPFEPQPTVAVAVSGGADSMALLRLMHAWVQPHGGKAIALTVDHGLRAAAKGEARQVRAWCKTLGIEHHILMWTGDKPTNRVLEIARTARYDLLQNWCRKQHILHLAVAHHADDQLETLLLRFSKGSGVNGLIGMQTTSFLPHVQLLRPLLSFSKQQCVATCAALQQPWLEDPSNHNSDYARPRLRESQTTLAREGLTAHSAQLLAARMALAEEALEKYTINMLARAARLVPDSYAALPVADMQGLPLEIQLRALTVLLQTVYPEVRHIRHAQLRGLQQRLQQPGFRGATLAGCKIKNRQGRLTITRE